MYSNLINVENDLQNEYCLDHMTNLSYLNKFGI